MGFNMYEECEGDIAKYKNAVSPICSECGNPLEESEEIERGCCIICWDFLTR